MAPMQHFINVIAAVTTGPMGAFIVALIINILRMLLMGITPLAITGSVFGAALAGRLYVRFKKNWAAALGEWIGTGLIGSVLSYPVMHFIMGVGEIGWFTYVPGFIAEQPSEVSSIAVYRHHAALFLLPGNDERGDTQIMMTDELIKNPLIHLLMHDMVKEVCVNACPLRSQSLQRTIPTKSRN